MADCLIAFGANEGAPQATFKLAINAIESTNGVTSVVSGEPMMTKPVGGPADQPSYLNAAIRISTELDPAILHERLIEIESELGRERRVRWGSRKIDLDLLLHGGEVVETKTLSIPHSRMSFRRFVLKPCQEIAGDMVHPTSGRTINQLLEHLDSRPNIIAWVNPDGRLLQQLAMDGSMAGWTLVPVTSEDELMAFEELTKLVVVHQADFQESPPLLVDQSLYARALNFAGPSLRLRESDDTGAEVRAAAAAAACE